MTYLGLKQGQDFGETWRHAPTKNSQEYPPLPHPRVFSSRSFSFIWFCEEFCYFFVTPFRPCQTLSHVTSALTQFIIHASSDVPQSATQPFLVRRSIEEEHCVTTLKTAVQQTRCSEDLQGFNERVTLHAQTIVLQYYLPEMVYRVFL